MTSPSRHIARAVRRLSVAQRQRGSEVDPPFFFANVVSVAAGQANDGNALVQVSWRTSTVTANAYLNTYTPVVGDRVTCAYDGKQIVVLGKNVGWT